MSGKNKNGGGFPFAIVLSNPREVIDRFGPLESFKPFEERTPEEQKRETDELVQSFLLALGVPEEPNDPSGTRRPTLADADEPKPTNFGESGTVTINLQALRPGDLIRWKLSGDVYVVTANYGDRATAVSTVDVTSPDGWEFVDLPAEQNEPSGGVSR